MARVADKESRAGNVALFDGLLDADVAVARAFGFNIAQGGEPLLQGAARGDCGPRRAQSQGSMKNIGVVSALVRVFSLQKDVGVRIDEAGQNGFLGEIDDVGAGGYSCAGRVGDTLDAVATDDDDLIMTRRVGLPSISTPARMTVTGCAFEEDSWAEAVRQSGRNRIQEKFFTLFS